MKHKSSQILFAHWNEQRASRLLPERSEIDPGGIRSALADTFILAFNPLNEHPFRLAGTRVCALFGKELKSSAFTALWSDDGASPVTQLVGAAVDDSIGVVANATGLSENGQTVDLELLLLPLSHCGQSHLRLIGALAPLSTPYWLGTTRLTTLILGQHRYVGHRVANRTLIRPPAVPAARMRRGLMVYDGGQV